MEKKDILYTIYSAETGIDIFDLLYECSIGYGEVKPFLDEWVAQDLLKTEDGRRYKLIGDGRMFLGKHREEDSLEERRVYLETRRQDLIRRMQEEMHADDEDGAEEDEDETEVDALDFDEYLNFIQKNMGGRSDVVDQDEENDFRLNDDLCKLVFKNIVEGIAISKQDDHCFIEIKGIELYETDAKFEIFPCDGKVYLWEQGATLCRLNENVVLTDEKLECAKHIAIESGSEIIGNMLCIEVHSKEQMLAYLLRLYATMERIWYMGDMSCASMVRK